MVLRGGRPMPGMSASSQLKVMSAIEACRTEALGGHVAGCAKCGHQHIAYNSCKNRHCPKCQGPAARDWMAARAEDLLPVEYFHVVFTLPAEIAQIAYWNKKAVYGLLFKASAETVMTIAADPKRLGARVGMTSVLHTWGSALTHHPHIHMIVPGGGLSPDGTRWVACKPGFFLHVRVLSRLFRRLFLDGLMALHRAGQAGLLRRSRPDWPTRTPSPPGSPRSANPNGWSMPNRPSAAPRRCWPISAATPTGSRSRTTAWSAPMPRPSRSAGRITASSPATGKRSCGWPRASSSAAS